MTDTFTWQVHNTADGGGELAVTETPFGDGYKQQVVRGLNPDVQKWNVTISGYKADAAEVLQFIRDHVGVPFFWTPPLGVQGYYTCKRYKPRNVAGTYYTLDLEFEQAHAP